MPASPSFSVRPRPNYRRRRTIAALVLLVIGVIVVALLSRSGGLGKNEPPIATLAFVSKVNTVSQGKALDAPTRQAEGEKIVKMFNSFYQEAFVDPGKWGDGTFEDLKQMFSKDAQASFTKDIQSLTIGLGRTELRRVDPSAATIVVTLYYDTQSKPAFAVAAATFSARGTLKRTGPPVFIKQTATFYLQRSGDAWMITAYDADQSQETPTPSPTATAT